VPIPRDHVGAFVAEAFEDPERDTDWGTVVETVVADEARTAWESLSPSEQAAELLSMAADYDRRATELLASIPLGGTDAPDMDTNAEEETPPTAVEEQFEEATRRRRNADLIRDGIADAYAAGRIDDEAILEVVETVGFDTGRIARRERRLEAVADAHGFDFRPYGGTLFSAEPEGSDDERRGGRSAAEPTWELDR